MNLYLAERKPLYEGTKTLPAVNTLKLFMALMVVGIHLPFYGKSYVFDYLCIDYAIAIAYDNIESIKQDIDEGAIYLPDLYLLQNNLNAPITAELKHHISTYAFSKLSWKCETKDTDENGNQTVYSYLKSL